MHGNVTAVALRAVVRRTQMSQQLYSYKRINEKVTCTEVPSNEMSCVQRVKGTKHKYIKISGKQAALVLPIAFVCIHNRFVRLKSTERVRRTINSGIVSWVCLRVRVLTPVRL